MAKTARVEIPCEERTSVCAKIDGWHPAKDGGHLCWLYEVLSNGLLGQKMSCFVDQYDALWSGLVGHVGLTINVTPWATEEVKNHGLIKRVDFDEIDYQTDDVKTALGHNILIEDAQDTDSLCEKIVEAAIANTDALEGAAPMNSRLAQDTIAKAQQVASKTSPYDPRMAELDRLLKSIEADSKKAEADAAEAVVEKAVQAPVAPPKTPTKPPVKTAQKAPKAKTRRKAPKRDSGVARVCASAVKEVTDKKHPLKCSAYLPSEPIAKIVHSKWREAYAASGVGITEFIGTCVVYGLKAATELYTY